MDDKLSTVPNTPENRDKCLCPGCPAYSACMEGKKEILYCSTGATSCKLEKWGCHCPRCPVQLEYKMVGLFYCEKGAFKRIE